MTTKSKHKPVTLAKSVADFSAVDVTSDTSLDHEVLTPGDEADEKPVTKTVKAAKTKAVQGKSVHLKDDISGDIITVYRSIAERSLDQAKHAFVKARDEAYVLSSKIEESSTALADGTSAVQSYVVKAVQAQADDLFGYLRALADVKTVSDVIELQSSQSRKALDSSLRQFKDLSQLVNDMTIKAATPIRSALPNNRG